MPGRDHHYIALGVVALFALLIASGVALVGKKKKDKENSAVLPPAHRPLSALPIGAERTIAAPHGFWGACHSCHPMANVSTAVPLMDKNLPRKPSHAGANVPAWLFRPPARRAWYGGGGATGPTAGQAGLSPSAGIGPAAFSQGGGARGLLSPVQQNAAGKIMVEGHWMGMETMNLTPALRRIYKVPADIAGVMVDEITLESAESGILAGDVVTSVQGRPTRNLEEFFQATRAVSERSRAEVAVYRMGAETRFLLAAKKAGTLGFAQMEGAPPIRPGALSPHRERRRACTDCHVIMTTGGQLPVDAGDVLPSPPPIAANAVATHRYRGECGSCHAIR